MRFNSHNKRRRVWRHPAPACMPRLKSGEVSALYRAARVGGDFFDFVTLGPRLVLMLLDIAGQRREALDIAASVQDKFRARVPELFEGDINETSAVSELLVEVNRSILRVAGVRCSPGFLACYNESVGTLAYGNAGHIPALLRDPSGTTPLAATGLPLGLFSHATHDVGICVLQPGAAFLLVSKGLIEARLGQEEFGLERLKECLAASTHKTAQELCQCVLDKARSFMEQPKRNFFGLGHGNRLFAFGRPTAHEIESDDFESPNDLTTLALVRYAAAKRAAV